MPARSWKLIHQENTESGPPADCLNCLPQSLSTGYCKNYFHDITSVCSLSRVTPVVSIRCFKLLD